MGQLSLVAARVPLTAESYRRCRDELLPGQVKRVSAGPNRALVGYVIACPACGVARPHLDDDVGFQEGPGLYLIGVARPPTCSCGLSLRVVVDPSPALEAVLDGGEARRGGDSNPHPADGTRGPVPVQDRVSVPLGVS